MRSSNSYCEHIHVIIKTIPVMQQRMRSMKMVFLLQKFIVNDLRIGGRNNAKALSLMLEVFM